MASDPSIKKGKVLVTGAAGFIASHIVPALLRSGYRVVGIDRLPCTLIPRSDHFTFIKQDIADVKDLRGFDYVVHLAFATNIPNSILDPVGTTITTSTLA